MPGALTVSNRSGVDGDDLTEQQVNELLAQATARLQAKAESKALTTISSTSTRFTFPKLDAGAVKKPAIVTDGHLVKVASNIDQQQSAEHGFRQVEDPVAAKALAIEKTKATAGPMWFDLPKTNLTPELKRDLQLLKMRGVLDPHRHYKKENGKVAPPEFSMVGRIREGATEFYTGRIENKQRKRTFVEEVLSGEQQNGRFKRKYGDVQARKSSGKKSFYKDVKAKRFSGVKKGG